MGPVMIVRKGACAPHKDERTGTHARKPPTSSLTPFDIRGAVVSAQGEPLLHTSCASIFLRNF